MIGHGRRSLARAAYLHSKPAGLAMKFKCRGMSCCTNNVQGLFGCVHYYLQLSTRYAGGWDNPAHIYTLPHISLRLDQQRSVHNLLPALHSAQNAAIDPKAFKKHPGQGGMPRTTAWLTYHDTIPTTRAAHTLFHSPTVILPWDEPIALVFSVLYNVGYTMLGPCASLTTLPVFQDCPL